MALIKTTTELEAACETARAEGVLSLDTEFVWNSTYRPRLGLVQMGTRSQCWAIDCLTGLDPTALKALIEDEEIVKILHDARQDLTIIRHWTVATPVNVFDTQLAAGFAGFESGMGLQRLLFDAIDVGLAKTQTLTDWMQRPLTDEQVAYALDDVRYLPALKDELVRRAVERGTLEEMYEALARYDDEELYAEPSVDEAWRKIKLYRVHLDEKGLKILKAVASAREELARERNLPRKWLGQDGSLIAMAQRGKVGAIVHRFNGGEANLRVIYERAIERALF